MLPPITQVLTRKPATTIASGITTSQHLGTPTFRRTFNQFKAYIRALSDCRCNVAVLAPDDALPDAHFVEDTAVIFRELVFLGRPRNPARMGEVDVIADVLPHVHQVRLHGDDAYLEGGDVLFCADRVLIGVSGRTNRAGAEQLRAALRDMQSDIRVEFVPFEGVLHLKTGMTALSNSLILQSCHLKTNYRIDFAETVTLPEKESYAANVLPINKSILIPRGYRTVEKLATRHYSNVISLNMSEFEKMDGGLTCLSLRY